MVSGRGPIKNIEVSIAGGSASDGAIVDGTSSAIKATVFDYTTSNPLATTLVDTNGDPVSVGGGTQYTEDAAAAANPVGTAVNLVRQDTPSALVTTDGDNVTQRGTNYGAAYTQVVTSAGAFVDSFGGGTQYTEDVAAAADPVGTMGIAVRADSLAAVTTTDGDNIAFRATNKGELYVKQTDAVPVTDNGGSLTVDNPILSVVGSGTEAAAMRVTIATDSTGVLSVDDNGGSLTVDGTITEANSAAIAASLSVMDDWDETNRCAVNLIAGQSGIDGGSGVVGLNTVRTTLATDVALPVGANVIGKVSIDQTTPGTTNLVAATGTLTNNNAAPSTNNIGVLSALANAATPTWVEGNIVALSTDLSGRMRIQGTGATGSAVPGVAVYNAGLNGSGNLEGVRNIGPTLNTTTGIAAAGMVAVFDDATPTSITENQFGAVRMSTNRNLYNTIRDAAGNERGLNVDANGEIGISAVRSALPAGTNAIGKLAANSGVDIGDVDITSIASGTNAIGRVGHDITGMGHGVKTVTTAGTDEALAGSTACKRVVIQSQTDNTSGIAVGASGVDATVATGTGVYLNPGDAFELEIDNLADVFVDSLVNGEGVRYTYFT